MKIGKDYKAFLKHQKGAIFAEFTIIAPVLLLLFFTVVDFGRVMHASITVTNAARAGAGYGAQSPGTSINSTGIQQASLADATNLPVDSKNANHVDVTSRRFCRCNDSTSEVSCASHGCPAAPQIFVEVTTQREFQTLVSYPLIPDSISLSRTATIRVH